MPAALLEERREYSIYLSCLRLHEACLSRGGSWGRLGRQRRQRHTLGIPDLLPAVPAGSCSDGMVLGETNAAINPRHPRTVRIPLQPAWLLQSHPSHSPSVPQLAERWPAAYGWV